MAKTQEELNQLKVEFESLAKKLNELNEDELREVAGGTNLVGSIPGILNGEIKPFIGYAPSQNADKGEEEIKNFAQAA